jgi:hypothetical protein
MSFNTNTLRKVWDKFLDHLLGEMDQENSEEIERSIGFGRLREQLWDALENSTQAAAGWAYPIDVYIGDDGSSLFSIVTQNGKLFQVPITISEDNLSLGEWTQVTEVFEPVSQSKLVIRELPDGSHRWLGVVATSVINRVGQIDSTELFDSFVAHWLDTGEDPRVDYYHMGDSDPEAWEFGTADYLAREGCCYIASGTFDEDHPLAKATIQAYERDPEGTWGWSIEFYALTEAEVLKLEPKIQVPVYKKGKNTRISVVKEVDAAGLFTRIGITEEKTRMKRDIMDKLEELFGDDETALAAFVENVDTVNRTIKDDKLIHRSKTKRVDDPKETPAPKTDPKDEDVEEDDEEDDGEEEGAEEEKDRVAEIVLDDAGLAALATQVTETPFFKTLQQSLTTLQESVGKLASGKEEDAKEITRLKKVNAKMAQRLEAVEVDETDKKQTYLEDLPRKRAVQASYRPRVEHAAADEDGEEDYAEIANGILKTLPKY